MKSLQQRLAAFAARIGLTGLVVVLLCAALVVQTVRLEGFHIWPVSVTGWIKSAQLRANERDAERTAHRETKIRIAEAAREAQRLERARLERIRAEQQEISDAIRQGYASRLAAARTRADRLRKELQARTQPAAATAGLAVPGLSATAAGTDGAPEDPRLPAAALTAAEELERNLIATEQALQLDALIDWIRQQTAIDPNKSEEIQP